MRDGKGAPWEFSMTDVLCLVGAQVKGKPTHKGELEVLCPLGVKKSDGQPACLGVNLQTNGFKCFHECSECISRGGMLDLYNLFLGRPQDDKSGAKKEILERLARGEEAGMRRAEWTVGSCREKESELAHPVILDLTYRRMLASLTLSEHHRKSLEKRGLGEEEIDAGLYRSVPTTQEEWKRVIADMKSAGVRFEGIPGFYRKNGEVRSTAFKPGFFIPYFNEQGQILGLQIRYDVSPKEKGKRYMWFSSRGYENGCGARNIASFGIPGLMPRIDSGMTVYVTEGALKSYVANVLDGKHHPFVAIAGVNCWKQWEDVCRTLKANGVTTVIDVFDSDREENPRVMRAIAKLYTIANEQGIIMRRFNWGTQQKGIDDYLLAVRERKNDAGAQHRKNSIPPPPERRLMPLPSAKPRQRQIEIQNPKRKVPLPPKKYSKNQPIGR